MEKTMKLYSLPFCDVRTYMWATLFVICNMVLPQVCHLLPQGGIVLAPLSFVILFGACRFGWRVGLLAAAVSPLVNHLAFGIPAWEVLPVMSVKLCVLALLAGLAVNRMKAVTLPMLITVVVGAELVGGGVEWLLTGGVAATIADFVVGWPGLILQVFGTFLLLRFTCR